MRTTRAYLIVLACFIGLLGIAFGVGYTHAAHLGLDLQGGLEVVLKAEPKSGQKVTQSDIDQSVSIIRSRVDKLGVSEPEIRTQGTDQIAVDLPGLKDTQSAVNVIGSTAQLHFYDFNNVLVGSQAYRDAYQLLQDNKGLYKKGQTPDTWYLFDKTHKVLAGPTSTKAQLLADSGGKLPKGDIAAGVPNGYILVHGQQADLPIDNENTTGRIDPNYGLWVLLKDKPSLSGSDITNAQADTDSSGWVTTIQFNGKGSKEWTSLTRKLARDGELDQSEHALSIVLDNEIKSSPVVDYRQFPDGIPGGTAEITGLGSQKNANDLAVVLQTGSLPVRFTIIAKNQVSATLGKQSLKQGLLAGAAGLAIVMLYLIVFYRFLGLIADVALLSYAFLFYALIVGLPIVMTLPGIAGMILTVGVAADANIIIFERIREEYRDGRTVRAAIQGGYVKGLKTILDANVVTLITACVLVLLATSEVKGFALLLLAGVILSMITAVAATYALLGLLSNVKFFRHPAIIGAKRKPIRFHLHWMKARNFMFAWTAIIMLTAIGLVSFKGLNLGIDFKSGTQITVNTMAHPSESKLRAALTAIDPSYSDATIQTITEPSGTKSTKQSGYGYQIQLKKLHNGKQGVSGEDTVKNALNSKFQVTDFSSQTIGATFGHQVLEGAIISLLLCFALEIGYIAVRFEGKYALPVFVALVHDLLVATGAYALTGREFNSATLSALLTILGYSLYDTIIVFDRVRENVKLLRKSSFARIVDVSLNEVLTRSINTSIVTLLPVAAIFFFGGATLQDFAYALLVGVFAGAYSSIIVASPILAWLKEREPAWAKRIGVDDNRAPVEAYAEKGKSFGSAAAVEANVDVNDPDIDLDAVASPIDSAPAQRRRDRRSRAQRKS